MSITGADVTTDMKNILAASSGEFKMNKVIDGIDDIDDTSNDHTEAEN